VLEQPRGATEDVDYFEVHGQRTRPTFNQATKCTRKLRIGYVKSNLNHIESASDLAVLAYRAILRTIRNKTLVPNINIKVLAEKGLTLKQIR
ncbi:unnamed protein product, partial [Pocillopora meandrina]